MTALLTPVLYRPFYDGIHLGVDEVDPDTPIEFVEGIPYLAGDERLYTAASAAWAALLERLREERVRVQDHITTVLAMLEPVHPAVKVLNAGDPSRIYRRKGTCVACGCVFTAPHAECDIARAGYGWVLPCPQAGCGALVDMCPA